MVQHPESPMSIAPADVANGPTLIRLRPRPDTVHVSNGRTVLATGTDGFLDGRPDQGLFVHETRLLSRYQFRIEGVPLYPVSSSNVVQSAWLGYYIAPSPSHDRNSYAHFNVNAAAQQSIQLRLSRSVGDGFHEDVELTNFTQLPVEFDLMLELDSDFADLVETHEKRQQFGKITYESSQQGEISEWRAEYDAVHPFSHLNERGEAR